MRKKIIGLLSLLCVVALGGALTACDSFLGGGESNFEFEKANGGYAVVGVKEIEKGKIEIPSVYNNKAVVAIADGAFENENSLVYAVIPDSVETIGASAFAGCANLETVKFGAGVTTLGESVFAECVAIKTIELPESLVEIGNRAFDGCQNLKEITVPDCTKQVGDFAFTGCAGLKTVVIGDSLEWIGVQAFAGNEGLLTVSISESAPLTIGTKAFNGCSSLWSLDLGGTVTVGASAFESCGDLGEVVLGDNCVSVDSKAFASCMHLTGVTIGPSVVSVASDAFVECRTLVEVYNRSRIGINGISIKNLKHVYKEEGGSRRFKDEYGVVYYQEGESVIALGQVGGQTGMNIVFDERTTEILPFAFYNNLNLSSITLGDKVQKIGERAFTFCYKLQKVTLGDGLTMIESRAFDRCSILNMVVLGANVTFVGERAFDRCEMLKAGRVYYKGDVETFLTITFEATNENLTGSTIYYYSVTQPTASGTYWRYDENGKIRLWE